MDHVKLVWPFLVLAACKPDLGARTSLVTEERVLAVRIDPPEAAEKDTVAYSILIASPSGDVTMETVDWAWCNARKPLSELEPVNPDCLARAADFIVPLGAGMTASGDIPNNACRLFGPEVPPPKPGEMYGRPVDPDPTGGYYQPVRVLVGDGSIQGIATVRIACGIGTASPDAILDFQKNYVTNKNPEITGLTTSPTHFDITWKETESYIAYDRTQLKNVPRREAMSVAWFVTAGTVASDRTGRAEDDPATNSGVDYTAQGSGTVHGWAVLRDDRGGVAWQSFMVQVP
jgi:hypothetical protein